MRGLTRPLAAKNQDGLHSWASYVQVVHARIRGRTRFRIRGLRQSRLFGALLRDFLERQDGFVVLEVNVTTASLLLQHPPETDPRAISCSIDQAIKGIIAAGPLSQRKGAQSPKSVTSHEDSLIWSQKTADQTAIDFSVSLKDGLTSDDVEIRLRCWGPNIEPPPPVESPWSLLWHQYRNLPSALLGTSAILSLLSGARLDAFLILGVLATNGTIGYTTEKRTSELISNLGIKRLSLVPVVRDGALTMVPGTALVPGDIVILEPGPISADIRIAECDRLYTDESSLTGESTAVAKSPHPPKDQDAPLAERRNILFAGTTILSGHGRGIVIATGRLSEIGRIQELMTKLVTPPTPLQAHLTQIGDLLVKTSVGACAALFFIGLARGLSSLDMLKTAISLAIAAVPEGLPTVGTTTMALGIASLQKKDVFVRHLAAVENLGAVSVICFDKTGTITLNQMMVTDIVTASAHFEIEEGTLLRDGIPSSLPSLAEIGLPGPDYEPPTLDLHRIAMVSVLCNDAQLASDTEVFNQLQQGSSTETALLRLAKVLGIGLDGMNTTYPRFKTRLRSESSMYMATWHRCTLSQSLYLAVKGSPEEILDLCAYYLEDGEKRPLSDTTRRIFLADNQRLANKALRVLALAEGWEKPLINHKKTGSNPKSEELTPQGLVWLGLVGLKDPPRAGVGPLLEAFHGAGIRTNMITGDQETTAQAIGRDLGMNGDGVPPRLPIFSRVSPADKLKIIQSLQAQGAVVAMTGDGVNDSPALRAADIGIAMGQGAGAAIDAAQVILAQGQLEALFEAVKLGRTIRANMTKSIHFLISTNLSELLVTFIGVLIGQSHLLNTKQLLWINLLTDVFPAIGLAFEAAEPNLMLHPPIDRRAALFDQSEWERMGVEAFLIAMGAMTSYGVGFARHRNHDEASTMAFFSLTMAQLLEATSARTLDDTIFSPQKDGTNRANPWLQNALRWGFLAQSATIFVPFVRSIIGNTPLGAAEILIAAMCGGFPFVVSQASKSTTSEILKTQDPKIRRQSYVF